MNNKTTIVSVASIILASGLCSGQDKNGRYNFGTAEGRISETNLRGWDWVHDTGPGTDEFNLRYSRNLAKWRRHSVELEASNRVMERDTKQTLTGSGLVLRDAFRRGILEARLRMKSKGNFNQEVGRSHAAFWAICNPSGHPNISSSTEIDVLEVAGESIQHNIYRNIRVTRENEDRLVRLEQERADRALAARNEAIAKVRKGEADWSIVAAIKNFKARPVPQPGATFKMGWESVKGTQPGSERNFSLLADKRIWRVNFRDQTRPVFAIFDSQYNRVGERVVSSQTFNGRRVNFDPGNGGDMDVIIHNKPFRFWLSDETGRGQTASMEVFGVNIWN